MALILQACVAIPPLLLELGSEAQGAQNRGIDQPLSWNLLSHWPAKSNPIGCVGFALCFFVLLSFCCWPLPVWVPLLAGPGPCRGPWKGNGGLGAELPLSGEP